MTKYLNAYVDQRMAGLIEEWQLARKDAISEMDRRLSTLEREIVRIRAFQSAATDRIEPLEARLSAIRERMT